MASVLKVDKLDPQSGTALEIGTSGDTISIPSGATLDISASTLTPPATMPASSGINLTALNATNLGSGTVPTARLGSGTASSSTILYGDQTYKTEPSSGGITAASQWRNTTSFSGDADPIASNLELVDTYGYGSLGSDMTESSGIFTFPSTGYWLVAGRFYSWLNGQNAECYGYINTTTDNSSYNIAVQISSNMPNFLTTGVTSSYGDFILDVTSTSLVKVSFSVSNANTSNNTDGNTAKNKTAFTFIRLGDT